MLDFLQWPALAVTVAAVWLIAADARDRRLAGFSLFLFSNVLWAVWAWHVGVWGLVALQAALVVPSVRGVLTNRDGQPTTSASDSTYQEPPWSQRPEADYAALVREGLSSDPSREAPPSRERMEVGRRAA